MIYVALTEVCAIVLLVALFGGILRSQSRAHARREDLLLNQIMHLAGATWEPPPSEQQQPGLEPEIPAYSFAPEQEFDAVRD